MDAIATWQRPNLMALLGGERPAGIDALKAREVRSSRETREASAESFETLYREHYRDVYRYVLLSLRRPDDVDDIVADTFDRAFAAWRSGHGPAGRALPWLIVIARRILVDRWRRNRLLRWLPLPGGSGQPEPRDSAEGADRDRTEFWLWLDRLADALPDRQREVVFLRYQRDLSDEDIGEILGLSSSGVRTLASRALAALRQHPEIWS
jgi:RNA polymerase sigma factor (sigma-70 family)